MKLEILRNRLVEAFIHTLRNRLPCKCAEIYTRVTGPFAVIAMIDYEEVIARIFPCEQERNYSCVILFLIVCDKFDRFIYTK